ncbi:MAG TPA: BON domain-containing protein [Candidatus Elarobacter sp.]|jgi:osmotically-inducible protein OsmY|nr:BON domain-containing protein [Candidatus Elarobacter sp.]
MSFHGVLRPVALVLALSAPLGGCTSSDRQKAAEALTTPAAGEVLQDALILAGVKAGLVAHDPDAATSVGVSVSRGVVTLRGVVPDAKTRQSLIEVAQGTSHVRRVDAAGLRVGSRRRRLRETSAVRNAADRSRVAGP